MTTFIELRKIVIFICTSGTNSISLYTITRYNPWNYSAFIGYYVVTLQMVVEVPVGFRLILGTH